MTKSTKEIVEAGMAWLDQHFPGHVERFDEGSYSMWGNCVLIQATCPEGYTPAGDEEPEGTTPWYWHHANDLALRIDPEGYRPADLGFLPGMSSTYMLEDAWIKAYRERKAVLANA
jgi:hypothetical protein